MWWWVAAAVLFGPVTLVIMCIALSRAVRAMGRGPYRAAPRIALMGEVYNVLLAFDAFMAKKAAFKPLDLAVLEKQAMKRAKASDFGDQWSVPTSMALTTTATVTVTPQLNLRPPVCGRHSNNAPTSLRLSVSPS